MSETQRIKETLYYWDEQNNKNDTVFSSENVSLDTTRLHP